MRSRNDFPYLSVDEYIKFPDPLSAPKDLPACHGANLSPGVLISAYSQGFFPWTACDDYIDWWSPDPRCVIYPNDIHISSSMKKLIKKGIFSYAIDQHFETVIKLAASVAREGQDGTWITKNMIDAYIEMHRLGFAHSFEVYDDRGLAGGLYGLSIGSVFFGESMFSLRPNASKAAFIFLNKFAQDNGFAFVDCQMPTEHLLSLGAKPVSRKEYMQILEKALCSEKIT